MLAAGQAGHSVDMLSTETAEKSVWTGASLIVY